MHVSTSIDVRSSPVSIANSVYSMEWESAEEVMENIEF